LEALLNAGALPIVLSHLGRPKGQVRPEYSLAPVAQRLAVLLDRPVLFVPDCIGEAVSTALQRAHPGREVVVLENVRFYPGEEANDKEFAAQLRHDAQVYINDAFGTLHRAHAQRCCHRRPLRMEGHRGYWLNANSLHWSACVLPRSVRT
jgi:3-phosphoglycerate kinase